MIERNKAWSSCYIKKWNVYLKTSPFGYIKAVHLFLVLIAIILTGRCQFIFHAGLIFGANLCMYILASPCDTVSSCENPLVADDGAPTQVSLARQLGMQAHLPRPLPRGRVCPTNDPNCSCRMLHTHYRNNLIVSLKTTCIHQWKMKMRLLLITE